MSRAAPALLARPTRFARLRRPRARLALGLVALLLLGACLAALAAPAPTEARDAVLLHESIVAGVRGGGNYYEVAADSMRAAGEPLRPFVAMRLPGLALLLGALPVEAAPFLLWALAFATAIAWALRLRAALPRLAARVAAGLLLFGSLVFVRPELAALHEAWAGLLIALSLALRRPGRWIDAAAVALIAMLIRETAALYALVMAALAWREGARREALGWAGALVAFAAVLGVHGWAVAGVTGPLDAALPGWGLQGPGPFVAALARGPALGPLPLWAGALLVGLAALGWAAWDDPLGLRVAAALLAFAAAAALVARADTADWALLVAPVLLVGLVFVPDGLRDLARAALDRRRVTVTRVAR